MAIISWNHKGLRDFYLKGSIKGIRVDHAQKLRRALTILSDAECADELRVPGYRLHQLNPKSSKTWAITISGNWRLTFRFVNENAEIVDYVDYH